jgi:hypothetical protein
VVTLAAFRDVAIIVLALINIALIVVLLAIAILLWRMIMYVARETPEFVDKAKQMTNTAQGTVDFFGSTIARPAITATAFVAGVQRFFYIIALGKNRPPASQPPDDSTEGKQ